MTRITVDLIETVTPLVEERVREAARRLPDLRYADLRLEVTEAKGAGAENGTPKFSADDYGFSLGVRVLAGDRMIAPGYLGQTLGTADLADLDRIVREALERAYRRAMVNGEMKADAREKFGPLGEALADTGLCPIEVRQDTVGAVYRIDPRAMDLAEMVRYATDVSRQVAAVHAGVKYNYISALTEVSRELFVSSEGTRIDQSFALTQGTCTVVAVDGEVSQDLYDALGHQRGWEILLEGVDESALRFPSFRGFMNSRQTAAIFGGEPNGHWKATDASLVPLIRMSNTVFDAGTRAAQDIVKEVDRGYYLAAHRTPSIAESRENFRISARGVYHIPDRGLG